MCRACSWRSTVARGLFRRRRTSRVAESGFLLGIPVMPRRNAILAIARRLGGEHLLRHHSSFGPSAKALGGRVLRRGDQEAARIPAGSRLGFRSETNLISAAMAAAPGVTSSTEIRKRVLHICLSAVPSQSWLAIRARSVGVTIPGRIRSSGHGSPTS
jgi:hypothetical protein